MATPVTPSSAAWFRSGRAAIASRSWNAVADGLCGMGLRPSCGFGWAAVGGITSGVCAGGRVGAGAGSGTEPLGGSCRPAQGPKAVSRLNKPSVPNARSSLSDGPLERSARSRCSEAGGLVRIVLVPFLRKVLLVRGLVVQIRVTVRLFGAVQLGDLLLGLLARELARLVLLVDRVVLGAL